MAYGIQRCEQCGKVEHGHTGPADRYVCVTCHRALTEVHNGVLTDERDPEQVDQ